MENSLRLDVRFLAVRPLSATNHFHFRFFSFMKKISGQNENDHAGLLDHRNIAKLPFAPDVSNVGHGHS